jgi:hypothetical protein
VYRPRVIRGLLHTGGRSIAELKARYTGQGLTYRDFESIQRAFDLFDGQELSLFRIEGGDGVEYHVSKWPKENMKIMDAVYEAEQTHPQPQYKGDRQKFMLDWLQGKYSAGMAFAFRAEDVEELETVQEEINEPDPAPAEEAVPRWRQIRDKKRRRKGARKS